MYIHRVLSVTVLKGFNTDINLQQLLDSNIFTYNIVSLFHGKCILQKNLSERSAEKISQEITEMNIVDGTFRST